jgi:hypothetical protein
MIYRSERIRCPHLGKMKKFFCNADQRVYVPSLFQLEEYCRSMAHKKCPFFVGNASEISAADVSQLVREEYFNNACVRNERR